MKYFNKIGMSILVRKCNKKSKKNPYGLCDIIDEVNLGINPSFNKFKTEIFKLENKYMDKDTDVEVYALSGNTATQMLKSIYDEIYKSDKLKCSGRYFGTVFYSEPLYKYTRNRTEYDFSISITKSSEEIYSKYDPVPKVGKIYDFFDDGKIRESRRESVEVVSVIKYKSANKSIKDSWNEDKLNHSWVLNNKTDYFIKVKFLTNTDLYDEPGWFARSGKGWYSFKGCNGRLDVTGKLYKDLLMNS